MLAGLRTAPHQIEMRARRRQDLDAIDTFVGKDDIEAIGEPKWKIRRECLAARFARAERVRDLDAVVEVDQALRMRLDRHAEADDRDPTLGHFFLS